MSYHIRDVLKSAQDAAPPPRATTDDIIAQAGRIRARRAATAAAGGVVACIALAATAVAGLGASDGEGQPVAAPPAVSAPAGPEPSASAPAPVSSAAPVQPAGFTATLREYRAGQYKIGPAGQVAPGYQEIPVYSDGRTWESEAGRSYPLSAGSIIAYRAGVFDPATFGGRGDATLTVGPKYQVKVGGKAAVGRDLIFQSPVDVTKRYVRASLAWQYAPDAWATFVPDYDTVDLSRADARQIAAGLSTAPAREVRVPYRLGRLPGDWRAVAVTQTPEKVSSVVSKVFLHDGPLTESAALKIDEVFPHSAMITVIKDKPKDATLRGADGLRCSSGRATCTIVQGEYLIEVADWNETLTTAQVEQIAKGLRLRDLGDQKTWVTLGE